MTNYTPNNQACTNTSTNPDTGSPYGSEADSVTLWTKVSGNCSVPLTGGSTPNQGSYHARFQVFNTTYGNYTVTLPSTVPAGEEVKLRFAYHENGALGSRTLNVYENSLGGVLITQVNPALAYQTDSTTFTATANITHLHFSFKHNPGGQFNYYIDALYLVTSNAVPSAPMNLLVNGDAAPVDVVDFTPDFTAQFNDDDGVGEFATDYQIEVNDAAGFGGNVLWDSGKVALGTPLAEGAQCPSITYDGNPLSKNSTYYWRIKFWDDDDTEGAFGDSQFTMRANQQPAISSLKTNAAVNPTGIIGAPQFTFDFSDDDVGDTGHWYQIEVSTDSSFSTVTHWDSTKTVFGVDVANPGTSAGIDYAGSALSENTVYYWRAKIWDSDDFASAWSATSQFTTGTWTPLYASGLTVEGEASPATIATLIPDFSFIYNDDSGDIGRYYQIQVNKTSAFLGVDEMWDSGKVEFAEYNAGVSLAEGSRCLDIAYGGTELVSDVRYYWRVRIWDDDDNVSAYTITADNFICNVFNNTQPLPPSNLLVDNKQSQSVIDNIVPKMSFVYHDPNSGDTAVYFQIQVSKDPTFPPTALEWDTGKTDFAEDPGVAEGSRCQDIQYEGTQIQEDQIYYWRAKVWDLEDVESPWSVTHDNFIYTLTVELPLCPEIDAYTNKISRYYPGYVEDINTNFNRNYTLGLMFCLIKKQIDQYKDDMTITSSDGGVPFMVGVDTQPKFITGIRFFYIDRRTLINPDNSIREDNRYHTLQLNIKSGEKYLYIDNVSPIRIDESDIYKILDNNGYEIYIIIDQDKLPSWNIRETIEYIPIYTDEYLDWLGYAHKWPRYPGERDISDLWVLGHPTEGYRSRLKNSLLRGGISKKSIDEALMGRSGQSDLKCIASIFEHTEFFETWFAVDGYATDKAGHRKYRKNHSDNIDYVQIVVSRTEEPLTFTDDEKDAIEKALTEVMEKVKPQGLRYMFSFSEG